MFYIEENGVIVLKDNELSRLKTTLDFMPQYADLPILKTDKEIIEFDGKFVFAEDVVEEKAKEREIAFKTAFFEIPAVDGIFQGGYYRKVPKGYQSAVESINTAFNAVNVLGLLPQDYLIFYTKPDFTDETQCTEEWLVANQFRNQTMTTQEFGQFYVAFMTGWNNQEHKTDILA